MKNGDKKQLLHDLYFLKRDIQEMEIFKRIVIKNLNNCSKQMKGVKK